MKTPGSDTYTQELWTTRRLFFNNPENQLKK